MRRRRLGTRAGVAAIGRAVPFGVGAAIGYGINSRTVGVVSGHAHDFFTEFPLALHAIDVDSHGNVYAGDIKGQRVQKFVLLKQESGE